MSVEAHSVSNILAGMTYSELNKSYNQVLEYVSKKQLKEAFDQLFILSANCRNSEYREQLSNHFTTYQNMLRYSFELSDDPEKEKVYDRLLRAILELNDDVRDDIIFHKKMLSYYRYKEDITKQATLDEDTSEIIDKLTFEQEIEQLLRSSVGLKKSASHEQKRDYDQNLNNIFMLIWLTDKFGESEINLVSGFCKSDKLLWHDKCLIVSSLTLSFLRHFDPAKVRLLFDYYESGIHQVWQRALTGLVLGLYLYDDRLQLYPEIMQRLKAIQDDKKITKNIEAIIIQFNKTRETEKITKKINEEILPEMWKLRSTLEEKLNLDDILSSKSMEDKNPDWETVFEDSPELYDKIEEFSNMQLEGSDVFMSAFSMLKRFDFFNEFSHWFMPFYSGNENISLELNDVEGEFDAGAFLDGLERTSFLCNSDKYSFCMNVKYMPAAQKTMMVELFNMEINAMNEMEKDDEIINNESKNKAVFTQYIQDLYRFFKLHPLKHEFNDVFNYSFDIHNSSFFKILVGDVSVLRNLAEFYFQRNFFKEALEIFESLSSEDANYELYEKTAYCYQQLEQYEKALELYQKAEYLDKNRTWVLNKIALCYRKLGNSQKAIEYYQYSEKEDPENLYIQTNLGHACMDMEDYETALKYYYKVEYLDSKNNRVQRPIAWCSFMLGKFDAAKKYFEKIIAGGGNKNDFMNLGHVLWCMNERSGAIENYKNSLRSSEMDITWFSKVFHEDSKHLIRHGIPPFDIPLMLDYLKINTAS